MMFIINRTWRLHCQPAVDADYLAVNIQMLLGAEKIHNRRHVLRRPHAIERNERKDLVLRDIAGHLGLDEPGSDDVHEDVLFPLPAPGPWLRQSDPLSMQNS